MSIHGSRGRNRSGRNVMALMLGVGFSSLRPPVDEPQRISLPLQPMEDIDLAIRNGWGDVRQDQFPADWRTRKRGKATARREVHT